MNDLDKCFQVQKQFEHQRKVLTSNPIAGFKKQMELSQNIADQVVPSYLKDLHGYPFNKSLTLSDKERDNILQAPVSDSALIISYLDSVLKEKQDLMERQVQSLEYIAEQAYEHASTSHELSETARKHSEAANKQVHIFEKQLRLQQEQLDFAKSEAESAKRDALFAKVTSIIAIIISVLMPLISG